MNIRRGIIFLRAFVALCVLIFSPISWICDLYTSATGSDELSHLGKAEALMVDPLERALYYKRYIVYGSIGFNYDAHRFERTTGGQDSSQKYYSFGQTYDINLKSYAVHPSFLIFDLGFNWFTSIGTAATPDQKRYSLNLDFFRRKPLNIVLRADYYDSTLYQGDHEGITITYQRKRSVPTIATMRDWTAYNAMVRAKKNKNNNSDNNDNSDEEEDQDANKNLGLQGLTSQIKGNFLDRILPMVYQFDADRYSYRFTDESNTLTSYLAALRMNGNFQTRSTTSNYFIALSYMKYANSGSDFIKEDETRYSGRLQVNTRVGNTDNLHLKLYYEDSQRQDSLQMKTTTMDMRYTGYLTLKKKLWNYQVAALYQNSDSDVGYKAYYLTAKIGSTSDFGKIRTTYSLGTVTRYNDRTSTYTYALQASGSAATMITDKLSLNTFGRVHFNDYSAYSVGAEARYHLSRNLQLFGQYTYQKTSGFENTARQPSDSFFSSGMAAGTTQHNALIGLQGNVRDITFTSRLQYTRSTNGVSYDSTTWDNTLDTVFFNTVRFSLTAAVSRGTGLNLSGGTGPAVSSSEKTTRFSITNAISMSPWRRTALRVQSGYSSTTGGEKLTSYFIRPSFSWNLRKLYFTADYEYRVENRANEETREHRLTMNLKRPFLF